MRGRKKNLRSGRDVQLAGHPRWVVWRPGYLYQMSSAPSGRRIRACLRTGRPLYALNGPSATPGTQPNGSRGSPSNRPHAGRNGPQVQCWGLASLTKHDLKIAAPAGRPLREP
jgi:hypothetical protein